MVRLKEGVPYVAKIILKEFQFLMVRLKDTKFWMDIHN